MLFDKMDLNKRKIIFWILTFALMIFIFIMSSKNADDSTQDSHRIGKFIGYIVEYDFQEWTADAQERYAAKLDHPIRKTAHFLEYMMLGSLALYAWYDGKYRKKIIILVPFGIGVIYAITDELHQLFVSGRSGMVTDVLLDSAGVITGVLISYLIVCLGLKLMED